jgi:hypothetical protein
MDRGLVRPNYRSRRRGEEKIFLLPILELRPVCRLGNSQSLYRLSYRGSYRFVVTAMKFEMKTSIFWDVTPCSALKVNRYVPPKRRFIFNGLHGVISHETELYITMWLCVLLLCRLYATSVTIRWSFFFIFITCFGLTGHLQVYRLLWCSLECCYVLA